MNRLREPIRHQLQEAQVKLAYTHWLLSSVIVTCAANKEIADQAAAANLHIEQAQARLLEITGAKEKQMP